MFEITMLFAFLFAATCQLLPERPATTRTPLPRKNRFGKEGGDSLRLEVQKGHAAQALSLKIKSRNHSYAHAA